MEDEKLKAKRAKLEAWKKEREAKKALELHAHTYGFSLHQHTTDTNYIPASTEAMLHTNRRT